MAENSPAKIEIEPGIPGEFGMVCPRKIKKERRKRQKLLIIDLLFDFAKKTTLHGLRYFTEIGLTTVEKIFWIITFVISVILCFILIQRVWHKWLHSPVIVTFNENMIPVTEVLFPSITICPQWKCDTKFYNYMGKRTNYTNPPGNETFYNMTQEDLDDLDHAILICEDELDEESPLVDRNITNSSMVEFIRRMSPRIQDVFWSSRWRGKGVYYPSAFKEVLTEEGVCFNFNAMANKTIFNTHSVQREFSYMKNTANRMYALKRVFFLNFLGHKEYIKEDYPLHGRVYGKKPDLDFILTEEPERNDMMCNSLSNGFKIYLHHPADMPQSSLYYYAAIPGQVTSLAIKATILNTSETLRDYRSDLRQCYYPGDYDLKYFKMYTPDNCRLECLSQYTYWMCKCVWFHMPHGNSSEICTLQKWDCVKKARDHFASNKFSKEFHGNCNCLPLCDSIRYEAEVLKTNFDFKKNYRSIMTMYGIDVSKSWTNSYNFSRVEVYFRDPSFVSMRRSELFGVTEFLANCGGLLGLFLGFSFLSLIEIFYFCTLRLWCTLKKDIKQEKKAIREKQF